MIINSKYKIMKQVWVGHNRVSYNDNPIMAYHTVSPGVCTSPSSLENLTVHRHLPLVFLTSSPIVVVLTRERNWSRELRGKQQQYTVLSCWPYRDTDQHRRGDEPGVVIRSFNVSFTVSWLVLDKFYIFWRGEYQCICALVYLLFSI